MNNRDRLIDLMSEHHLDRLAVAELVSVDRETVDHWLLPHESPRCEAVPDMALELLALKLARDGSQSDAGTESGSESGEQADS